MMRIALVLTCLILMPLTVKAFDTPSKEEVAELIKKVKAARALENIDPSAKDAVPVMPAQIMALFKP
jgi:hypothetical protein